MERGLAHVVDWKLLVAVFLALVALTGITVFTATSPSLDFGRGPNLMIAMIIATMKATLVCLFFMHLLWDRKLNLVVFASALLFVTLFVGVTLMDSRQYQPDIERRVEALDAQQPAR